MNSSIKRSLPLLVLAVALSFGTSGCLFFFGHRVKAPLAGVQAAPDKVLYTHAMEDLKHNHYIVGRLALQTLINTYPDSEYLAKAKLAIANSYYKQGGTDGLTQAAAQYQDFITFFPFLKEAAFAQYRIAMSHFRMMEKPDRDPTQALDAESGLQTMILKFPKSRWTAHAKQRLREVQEVLAEGDFEVASFYDIRGAYAAAAARLLDLTARYPLFSEADQANFMLANIYAKGEHNGFAARFYSKIVREYPLSKLAPEAKKQLVAMGYPVPPADPLALARMRKEAKFVHKHKHPGMLREAMGILHSGPDVAVYRAAHYGEPNLAPDTAVITARQVLEPSVVAKAAKGTLGGAGSLATASISAGANSAPGAVASGTSYISAFAASPVMTSGSSAKRSVKDPKVAKTEKKLARKLAKEKAREVRAASASTARKKKKKKKKGLLHKLVPF